MAQERFIKSKMTLERFSIRATRWIGSIPSLVVHSILFLLSFLLVLLGISFDKVLLVLTTIVSLEAIYLSIFIQMSVNRTTSRLRAVSKDIEQIHEHVEDISEDVDEIQKDVEEIGEDVGEIQEDVDELQKDVDEIQVDIDEIQEDVEDIGEDVGEIADEEEDAEVKEDTERFTRIEKNLEALIKEIQTLKQNPKKKIVSVSKKK